METVIWSWTKGFGLMLIPIVLGIVTGRISLAWWGVAYSGATYLQWAGIALLLWATLGIAGWEIQTAGGTSAPEVVNRLVYRIVHCLGTYCLAWSVSWPSVARVG